jgi:DNA-binding NtrC family response regulator
VTVTASVLVGDDDRVARDLLVEVLTREGYRVRAAAGGEECLAIATAEPLDLALVDLRMPDLDGLAVLHRLGSIQPGLPVIILTAFGNVDTAIEAIRAGAYDYLSKPFRLEEITLVVRRALEAQRLLRENRQYRQELRERHRPDSLVGHSPPMVDIYKRIARVGNLDTTVLILGETGTGKELVARLIHYASPRADRPFVVVDCAALPETLFESELFGHERGAFTGASAARRGLLETASGGTCLLDEIGELSVPLQAKMLRAIQERTIRRVGSNEPLPIDVRFIAATNRDLRQDVKDRQFREDLYFRLNVVTIVVPALRERPGDIPLLAQHFLDKHAATTGKTVRGFARESLDLLTRYPWPGNVRELEHAVERAVALTSSDLLLPDDFQTDLKELGPPGPALPAPHMTLDEVKRWYVERVLSEVAGNKLRAAETLGIDRRTLYRILDRQAGEDEDT